MIEGKKTGNVPKDNPTIREFETPDIEVGKPYEYDFSRHVGGRTTTPC